MSDMNVRLIDFHSHYCDASWFPSALTPLPAVVARAWPILTDIDAQLVALDQAGIDAKVLTAPPAMITLPGQPLPVALMERVNDRFAELIARYPQRLFGLATIDAFQGDVAIQEVERAITTLGLHGICVDCARGDRFLDDPQALPTLEAAAALGVPVFVHPVSPIGLTERLAPLGHAGILLARGTEDAASLLALLRSGIFDRLPDLKLVLPMIGIAALIFAGFAERDYDREAGWQGMRPATARKRFYIDTMCFDPATIRFAIEVVGAQHVLLGSDWPIMPMTTRQQIADVFVQLPLTDVQKAGILRDNTLRLFARDAPEEQAG